MRVGLGYLQHGQAGYIGHVGRIPLGILYSRVGSIPTPITGMKRNVTSIIVDAEHCVSFTGANRYSNSEWLVTCRMLTTLYNNAHWDETLLTWTYPLFAVATPS